MEAGRGLLRLPPALRVVRQHPQGEDGEVAGGDDEDDVSRTPQLDERRVLPCGRRGALDPGVEREQRGAGHAVLQAGPRGRPERPPTSREPFVEGARATTERDDLGAREVEPRFRHDVSATRLGDQSRPIHVATSASFPSASASVHQAGARASLTRRPPAASAAAIRASA